MLSIPIAYIQTETSVIQGSVLGSLSFLLHVNDVTDVFGDKCTCKLYADDIQLYSIVDQCEWRDMQSQLDALQQWSDAWQLNTSYNKCNVLYSDNRKNKPNVSMILGGENIPQVSQVKDLGGYNRQWIKIWQTN